MTDLQHFAPQKKFLVCVDSDGCAMDTMDIKHFTCFGPCMVDEWGLEEWRQPILDRWNQINLYTMTRGINRFKGLAIALGEIDAAYTPIEGVRELQAWAESAPELSNGALEKALPTAKGPCLAKPLRWSQAVNKAINALPESEKKPFSGAAAGLAAAARLRPPLLERVDALEACLGPESPYPEADRRRAVRLLEAYLENQQAESFLLLGQVISSLDQEAAQPLLDFLSHASSWRTQLRQADWTGTDYDLGLATCPAEGRELRLELAALGLLPYEEG